MSGKSSFQPKKTYSDTQRTFESSPFDQFFGATESSHQPWKKELPAKPVQTRKEFSIFNYQEYYERDLIKKQIKELTEQIKREIQFIKKADSQLAQEVNDIQKLTVDSLPEKPGIYHVRFLELILELLKSVRAKIGESRTWLQAMVTKKKKRGSLFAALSKKKGTQYSLSQELQTTRSVQ